VRSSRPRAAQVTFKDGPLPSTIHFDDPSTFKSFRLDGRLAIAKIFNAESTVFTI